MARSCPACGHLNDDSLGFCSKCGEPVDPDVRLAMDLKTATQNPKTAQRKEARSRDDDYEFTRDDEEETEGRSPLPWILLGVVVVAVVVWLFLR